MRRVIHGCGANQDDPECHNVSTLKQCPMETFDAKVVPFLEAKPRGDQTFSGAPSREVMQVLVSTSTSKIINKAFGVFPSPIKIVVIVKEILSESNIEKPSFFACAQLS